MPFALNLLLNYLFVIFLLKLGMLVFDRIRAEFQSMVSSYNNILFIERLHYHDRFLFYFTFIYPG